MKVHQDLYCEIIVKIRVNLNAYTFYMFVKTYDRVVLFQHCLRQKSCCQSHISYDRCYRVWVTLWWHSRDPTGDAYWVLWRNARRDAARSFWWGNIGKYNLWSITSYFATNPIMPRSSECGDSYSKSIFLILIKRWPSRCRSLRRKSPPPLNPLPPRELHPLRRTCRCSHAMRVWLRRDVCWTKHSHLRRYIILQINLFVGQGNS